MRPPLLLEFSCLIVLCVIWSRVSCQSKLPPGYHAFETGTRKHGSPPRVRPPPYSIEPKPCAGVAASGYMYSPRDTLCGDLNVGKIPLNPMGQAIHNQPYPFELIKNKTLHFLARSLPFLKDDIDSIPKVVKLSKPEREPQNSDLLSSPYDYTMPHVKKRSVGESSPGTFWKRRSAKSQLFPGNNWNLTEGRQKACEQKDGIMCQLTNSLSGNGILSQAAQVISAAQTAANTAQTISSVASLLHHFSGSSDQPAKSSLPGIASHLASVLHSGGISSQSAAHAGDESGQVASGSSNFNPMLAVLDYLASNSNGKSAVSTLLPARRQKPMDLDELASETTPAITSKIPPTPCPSQEEYIAPVFARNYQGVWKYIVQIPHEGYFTQTVQKTSCKKSKCDFMDGSCHESPRWVSLLVAEIFYPDARFPNPMPMPAPSSHYEHFAPSHGISPAAFQQHQQQQTVRSDKRQPHSMMKPSGWRSAETEEQMTASSKPEVSTSSSSSSNRRMKRQVSEEPSNDLDGKKNPATAADERECDGVDKIGCYTIRVYYDWFLVPGSCKCWKKTSQGSLDTLKKIFIGK